MLIITEEEVKIVGVNFLVRNEYTIKLTNNYGI